jgi:hypothetical protein
MKRRLRKNKEPVNFYAFRVKHGLNHKVFEDLLHPTTGEWVFGYLDWDKNVILYISKDGKEERLLDLMQVAQYVAIRDIDTILAWDMCLLLTNEPTSGIIKYV